MLLLRAKQRRTFGLIHCKVTILTYKEIYQSCQSAVKNLLPAPPAECPGTDFSGAEREKEHVQN